MSSNCLRDYILRGLGFEYRCLLTTVRNGTQVPSFDELADMLLGEQLLVKRIEEDNQSQVTVAMAAHTSYRGHNHNYKGYNPNYRGYNHRGNNPNHNYNYNPNPNYHQYPNYQ